MSHPIDDLFNKSLGERSYAYDEQAWQNAREVLGLKKKRKKRFFWFFTGGGVIALSMLVFVFSKNDVSPIASQGRTIAEDKIETPQSKKAIAKGPINTQDATPDQANEGLVSDYQNTKVQENEKPVIGTTSFYTSSKKSDIENSAYDFTNGGGIEVEEFSNYKVDLEHDAFSESGISVIERSMSKPDIVFYGKEVKLEKSVVADRSLVENPNVGLGFGASFDLRKLSIASFFLKERKLTVPDMVKVLTQKSKSFLFEKGLYILYIPSESGIEIGLNGTLRFDNNLSLGMGLGVSRASHESNDLFDAAQSGGSRVELNLATTNNYNYKSIVLPIRVSYDMKKHSLFAGLILKRAFVLSGFQEANTEPAMDMPNTAQGFDVSVVPVTSSISYNLNNVPELNRLLVFGQAGYSYRLSTSIDLSTAMIYHLERQNRVLPLINNIERSSLSQASLSGYIRLDYRF